MKRRKKRSRQKVIHCWHFSGLGMRANFFLSYLLTWWSNNRYEVWITRNWPESISLHVSTCAFFFFVHCNIHYFQTIYVFIHVAYLIIYVLCFIRYSYCPNKIHTIRKQIRYWYTYIWTTLSAIKHSLAKESNEELWEMNALAIRWIMHMYNVYNIISFMSWIVYLQLLLAVGLTNHIHNN